MTATPGELEQIGQRLVRECGCFGSYRENGRCVGCDNAIVQLRAADARLVRGAEAEALLRRWVRIAAMPDHHQSAEMSGFGNELEDWLAAHPPEPQR